MGKALIAQLDVKHAIYVSGVALSAPIPKRYNYHKCLGPWICLAVKDLIYQQLGNTNIISRWRAYDSYHWWNK